MRVESSMRLLVLLSVLGGCANAEPTKPTASSREVNVPVSYQKLLLKLTENYSEGRDQTTPVPVQDQGRRAFLVLDYTTTLRGDEVSWPDSLRIIDADSLGIVSEGELFEERYAVKRSPGPFLKPFPVDQSAPMERVALHRQLTSGCELLWPRFFEGEDVRSKAEQDAAALVLGGWDEVTERGFGDLYRAVGADWFQWLQRQKELRL